MEETILLNTENVVNSVVDYSDQLTQLIDISNNILCVNYIFLVFFILFCACAFFNLYFRNFF